MDVLMPPSSPHVRDLLVERLEALLADCEHVMDTSAHGQAFHAPDDFLYAEGRKFTQEILQQKFQERIEKTETADEGKRAQTVKKNASPK